MNLVHELRNCKSLDGKKKIIWVSTLLIDASLHKTTQLEVLRNLAAKGNSTRLFGMRSRRQVGSNELTGNTPGFSVFLLPLRYVPIITSIIYSTLTAILLPIQIIKYQADFVILEPDISALSSIPSLFLAKFRKTRFIFDIRSVPVDIEGFRGFLNSFWFNIPVVFAKNFFSGITIITARMRDEVCTQFSIDSKRIGIWTSGVSETFFDPSLWNEKGNKLRNSLGLHGKFVVFYHGRICENRGIAEMVKAMEIVIKKNPHVLLFILGSGPFASEVKKLIRDKKLQDNVFLHDSVAYEQVPPFISFSDVCIIPLPDYPYWRSQSPLKLLEYLSMEKVVIATDLPAHKEVLANEKCAIYISSVDPDVIAESIEYALLNKDKLANWGLSGRKIVLNRYTWGNVASDLEQYLITIE